MACAKNSPNQTTAAEAPVPPAEFHDQMYVLVCSMRFLLWFRPPQDHPEVRIGGRQHIPVVDGDRRHDFR